MDNIYMKWQPIDRRLFLHLIDGRDTKVFRGEFADWLVRRCAIKSVRKKINNIIDRRLFLRLIDGRDTKVFRGVFADWLVRRCAIKSVRKKINNMIEREPKASRKKKREITEDQNKKIMEALNNAKNKVISQLKKLPLDEQIDFLNEKPIGWLTKRKGGKYNRDKHIYPDNVQADYYYDLQAGGKLPHIELRREATNSRLAKSIIFKYIEQNKDLHTFEQSWTKTNSTMWVPPSFMLSLIIEEVYTKQRDINTLPVKLAKLIKSHWRKPKEVGHMLRLKSYFAYCWPQLKRRYIFGESAQKLDTETARFVYPDTSNDVMPEQVQTVARTRAGFGLHYKQKVKENR
jgi:hypothetical protein